MYHPPDVRWHVLNDTMSQYYLCHHRIFGLNALDSNIADIMASASIVSSAAEIRFSQLLVQYL
jgi:hypothetical protein